MGDVAYMFSSSYQVAMHGKACILIRMSCSWNLGVKGAATSQVMEEYHESSAAVCVSVGKRVIKSV